MRAEGYSSREIWGVAWDSSGEGYRGGGEGRGRGTQEGECTCEPMDMS